MRGIVKRVKRGACGLALLAVAVQGKAQAAGVERSTPATACTTPLTLILRPGLTYPGIHVAVSPYMPRAHVVVRVPLYPSAKTTGRHFYLPAFDVPDSPFLRTALAKYLVKEPLPRVEAWYYTAFHGCGFTWQGSGQTDDQHGHTAIGLDWGTRFDSHMAVEVSLQSTGKHATLVYYLADTLSVPARPRTSYLPSLRSATIRVNLPAARSGRTKRYERSVHGHAALAALRKAINSLSTVSPGPKDCPPHPNSATVEVVERSGRSVRITDRPACVGVTIGSYPALVDSHEKVWKVLERLAGK